MSEYRITMNSGKFLAKERKWKNAQEPMGFWLVAFWTIVAGLLTGTGLWMWMR